MPYQTFLEYTKARASLDKKKIDKIGPYRVYTVNPVGVRQKHPSYVGFTKFGTHLEYPSLIGENEIWVGKDVPEDERFFLIHRGVYQYEAKERGVKNFNDWAEKRVEWEREKKRGAKSGPHLMPMYNSPPDSIYGEYYCGIATQDDDVEVWLVDGDKIRKKYCKAFVDSGNGETYKWIPRQEIWVEQDMNPDDIPASVLHEYMEASLVKKKKASYDDAHLTALRAEIHNRKKKFEKPDVQALDRDEVITLSRKYK